MDHASPLTSQAPAPSADPGLAARVLRKTTWRLVPFLCLLYIFNILDRSNVGFARLSMQDDLGLSQAAFDLGYGIFYFGYLVFEVPSNLLLRRYGARRWIARIMISWGLVTCLTVWVAGPWSLYAVRIALGVAEAGFFPGIILYLTFWFPTRERARIIAWFMTAIAVAGVLGNPLSGAVMQFCDGLGGLKGWQWLFIVEGIPSVVLGFVVLALLCDNPNQAPWLTEAEKNWLAEERERDVGSRSQRHASDLLRAMVDSRVWVLIVLYSTVAVGANAAGAYLPKLVSGQFPDESTAVIGLLSALPHVCAAVGMTLWGAHSDRTGERHLHVAVAAFVAAAGWAVAWLAADPWIALGGLCLAQTGMMSMLPTFWAIPTTFLSGAAAAGGIALINSVANIGGIFAPNILGTLGLPAMVAILSVGGILALCGVAAKT